MEINSKGYKSKEDAIADYKKFAKRHPAEKHLLKKEFGVHNSKHIKKVIDKAKESVYNKHEKGEYKGLRVKPDKYRKNELL